jgi:hypothetical protein
MQIDLGLAICPQLFFRSSQRLDRSWELPRLFWNNIRPGGGEKLYKNMHSIISFGQYLPGLSADWFIKLSKLAFFNLYTKLQVPVLVFQDVDRIYFKQPLLACGIQSWKYQYIHRTETNQFFGGSSPSRRERWHNCYHILAPNLVLFKAQISLNKIVCDVCNSERVCNPYEIFSLPHAPKQIRNA